MHRKLNIIVLSAALACAGAACRDGRAGTARRGLDRFWALDEVPELHLTLDGEAIASLARAPKTQVAGSFRYGTLELGEVAIRLKGHRSLRAIDDKPSFKVRFDEYRKQRFLGARSLTLNNLVEDPTLMRELLGYRLYRAMGVPAPRVAYAQVVVNGTPYGLYAIIETIDEEFLERNFDSDAGGLYEGEWGCDLTAEDVPGFEKDHGGGGHDDLAALAAAAAGPADALFHLPTSPVDLRRFVAYLAVSNLIGDFDGYRHSHNYRVYQDPVGARWSFIPWGIDRAFKKSLSPYDSEGLLAKKCFADRTCRIAYLRALGEAADRLDELNLEEGMIAIASVIDAAGRADPRRPYDERAIVDARGDLLAFVRRRPTEVRAELGCLGAGGIELDGDGDGFGCMDCNDANPDIHPGAAERCDGVDDDCSGLADDAAACPCVDVTVDGARFQLCDLPMPWTEAAAFCAGQGRALATIDSPAQSQALYRAAWKLDAQRWWIGLSDRAAEGDFRWADGARPADPFWAGKQPDNDGCNQDCAALQEDAGGKWQDTHCGQHRPFVCR